MVQYIRLVIQWVFFAIFLSLMFTGKAQIWMGFIFLSILLAIIFSRYYCGSVCPINTLIRPAAWLSKKLQWRKPEIPAILKTEGPRWGVFVIFLGGLGYTIYTMTQGRKFPLPVIIITFGVLITLFINENSWHRYLCPWGTLLSLTGRFAHLRVKVVECKNCAACFRHCPAESIEMTGDRAEIKTKHCLFCLQCQDVCPVKGIKYTT